MGNSTSADHLEERLIDENQQLCRILNASVTTAKKKPDQK